MNDFNPSNRNLLIAIAVTLGIWGCAQNPGPSPKAQAEKIKTLEERLSKMEEEHQILLTTRDQMKSRISALEEDRTALEKKLAHHKEVVQERDDLKALAEVRTSERDASQLRCELFKKGLQELLGQDESMISTTKPSTSRATAGIPFTSK
ncbi:MAG: hypothetical protein EBT92_06645 [Planctomycetes bacterium]|nr:hypothetical protein [Planctomycetota bacterium]